MVIIEIIEILMLDKPLSESSRFRDDRQPNKPYYRPKS